MSAATIISQAFGEQADLYTTVLDMKNIDRSTPENISPSQLRKAYYKRALIWHPDKQASASTSIKKEAKLKFQAISLAYSILSDPEKKKEYDATGELYDGDDDEDGPSSSGVDAWSKYFNTMFGKVTTDDIDSFTLSYKCSEAEEADVLQYYTRFKGNLKKMLECVMCSEDVDCKRWVEDFIRPAIEKGTVNDYMDEIEKTLGNQQSEEEEEEEESEEEVQVAIDEDETESELDSDEGSKQKKYKKPAKKVTPTKKKGKSTKHKAKSKKKEAGPSEDLIAAIQGRRSGGGGGFGNFMADMEARYSSSKEKKSKTKAEYEDISDDEFDKIRSRLDSGSRKKKNKRT